MRRDENDLIAGLSTKPPEDTQHPFLERVQPSATKGEDNCGCPVL
jgi:hypothetical protein